MSTLFITSLIDINIRFGTMYVPLAALYKGKNGRLIGVVFNDNLGIGRVFDKHTKH